VGSKLFITPVKKTGQKRERGKKGERGKIILYLDMLILAKKMKIEDATGRHVESRLATRDAPSMKNGERKL